MSSSHFYILTVCDGVSIDGSFGPHIEGSRIIVECRANNCNPDPSMSIYRWSQGTQPTLIGREVAEVASFDLTLSQADNSDQLYCQLDDFPHLTSSNQTLIVHCKWLHHIGLVRWRHQCWVLASVLLQSFRSQNIRVICELLMSFVSYM